jgi:hypothetical protein
MNKWILGILILSLLSCKGKEKAAEEVSFSLLNPTCSVRLQKLTHQYMLSERSQGSTQNRIRLTSGGKTSERLLKIFWNCRIFLKKMETDYHETKQFVEELNSAVLTYTPKEADDAEIRRQEVIIQPSAEGDQVKTIFIETAAEKGNTSIKKKMLWEIDKWFRIVSITQKQNEPERIETVQVIWNN